MIAVIDIGSNSVRLMLWADGKVLYKRVKTTRLGEGLAQTARLSRDAISRTAQAVSEFYLEGKEYGAKVYAFATAAVRTAENGGEFCSIVEEVCGLRVDVVSGKEEALLALDGALNGSADGGVIDIGGASTEICLKTDGDISFSTSLDIGAVRLYDRCGDDGELLEREIGRALESFPDLHYSGKIYAVGGTASTVATLGLKLAEYSAEKVQDYRMPFHEIEALAGRLLSMNIEERKRMRGMDVRRADIIGGGVLLLSKIMKKMSLNEVYASDRDNLEGYLIMRGLS